MPAIRKTLLASLSVSAAAYAPPLLSRYEGRPEVIAPRTAPVKAVLHVDLADPVTFGVFFLWGSPVPVLFQALLKETENAPGDERERLAALASASGNRFMGSEPYNMGMLSSGRTRCIGKAAPCANFLSSPWFEQATPFHPSRPRWFSQRSRRCSDRLVALPTAPCAGCLH